MCIGIIDILSFAFINKVVHISKDVCVPKIFLTDRLSYSVGTFDLRKFIFPCLNRDLFDLKTGRPKNMPYVCM